jgi:hypothetical protein
VNLLLDTHTLISGVHEILPNRTGGAAMQKNLELLSPPPLKFEQ